MANPVPDYLSDAYDPDVRAMTVVCLGSAFTSFLFLATPDSPGFANPYYVGAVAASVFALLSSVAVLALERTS